MERLNRQQILSVAGATQKKGRWTMALCPCHMDGTKHPSKPLDGASLGIDQEGGVHCFSGCKAADVYQAFRERLGTEHAPEEQRKHSASQPTDRTAGAWHVANRNPDIAYEFRDPAGELVAVHGRWSFTNKEGAADKTLRWRLPTGTYTKGLAGKTMAELPLYRAHQIGAIPADAPIVFCEGEKATDACVEQGLFAVTGPGGAGQRTWGDALNVLRGRNVFLWPDNDEKGRDYCEDLEHQLRPIAAHVVWLRPPAEAKDDAFDYFHRGGTKADLLAGILLEPSTEILGYDHFLVRIPTPGGVYAFDLMEMSRGSVRGDRAVTTELTVRAENPNAEQTPHQLRINLISASAIDSLTRALGKHFGSDGVNWSPTIQKVKALAQTAFSAVDRVEPLAAMSSREPPTFVVGGVVPEGKPTVLFSNGGGSKTMLALDMALSVALGHDWMGRGVKQGNVLYVDYEDTDIENRIGRLLEGRGMDPAIAPDIPILRFNPRGQPMRALTDELRAAREKYRILLMITDSGGPACDGPPESSEAATGYSNALQAIGGTSLTILHTRQQAQDGGNAHTYKPFGSSFWHNMARRTWYVDSKATEGSSDFMIEMFCRKANDGRWPQPFGVRAEFDDTVGDFMGAITLSPASLTAATIEARRPLRDQIIAAVEDFDGIATYEQIAEWCTASENTVRKEVKRCLGTDFAKGPKDGRKVTIQLIARGNA